jgi:hypothetical protein
MRVTSFMRWLRKRKIPPQPNAVRDRADHLIKPGGWPGSLWHWVRKSRRDRRLEPPLGGSRRGEGQDGPSNSWWIRFGGSIRGSERGFDRLHRQRPKGRRTRSRNQGLKVTAGRNRRARSAWPLLLSSRVVLPHGPVPFGNGFLSAGVRFCDLSNQALLVFLKLLEVVGLDLASFARSSRYQSGAPLVSSGSK